MYLTIFEITDPGGASDLFVTTREDPHEAAREAFSSRMVRNGWSEPPISKDYSMAFLEDEEAKRLFQWSGGDWCIFSRLEKGCDLNPNRRELIQLVQETLSRPTVQKTPTYVIEDEEDYDF